MAAVPQGAPTHFPRTTQCFRPLQKAAVPHTRASRHLRARGARLLTVPQKHRIQGLGTSEAAQNPSYISPAQGTHPLPLRQHRRGPTCQWSAALNEGDSSVSTSFIVQNSSGALQRHVAWFIWDTSEPSVGPDAARSRRCDRVLHSFSSSGPNCGGYSVQNSLLSL